MSKNTVLNKHQISLLDHLSNDNFLTHSFYFTGGTALSEIYLQHRESIDLDFFSPDVYDPQNIISRLNSWSKELKFTIESEYIEPTHIYFLTFEDNSKLKVDFAHYPYKSLKQMLVYKNQLKVDSLYDIAANKLLTLTQRVEVKDFVDIYFLLQKYTFWDLKNSVQSKFNIKIDPYIFASDCMVVDDFDFLPRMIKPLKLSELQTFFHQLARNLGRKSIAT